VNIARFSLSNWMTYSTVPWLPESPGWSIAKGRIDEAEKILADLEFTDI
jgi:hypothetical protein